MRVEGAGFRVQGCRVQGAGFRASGEGGVPGAPRAAPPRARKHPFEGSPAPHTPALLEEEIKHYSTEICSGSEAGSYLRLVYHSTLGLTVKEKKKEIRV